MISALVCAALQAQPCDIVLINARIWSDGRTGFATSAGIRNGKFVAVGEFDPKWKGPKTSVIDAKGASVLPGLIDSHIHLLDGGMSLSELQLRDASTKEEFMGRIKEWAEKLPEGKWVLGGGWSVESWPIKQTPNKRWVDGYTGKRPLWLTRMDGHSGLANFAALKMAGITREGPPDPPGGVIERDPVTNEPTGILKENAMDLVTKLIPPASKVEKLQALKTAIQHCHSMGITSVSDIPGLGDLSIYEAYAASNQASMRTFLYPSGAMGSTFVARAKKFKGLPDVVEVKGFKAYMDGSLGSRTAYMREPFLGNSEKQKDWRGLPMPGVTSGAYQSAIKTANQSGYQAIMHAIGDESNHLFLNMVAQNISNPRSARARSEHAQHLLPEDIARFGELGVIASMQPFHKSDDGRYAESYIGADRCHSSYAFRSLLNAGAVLAFGSDWPVVSANPFLGIEAAVTGKTLDGKFWEIQENLTVAEALRSYTSAGAFAAFEDTKVGKIEPGYLADFVILSASPFAANPKWNQIKPAAVYVGGKKVFTSK